MDNYEKLLDIFSKISDSDLLDFGEFNNSVKKASLQGFTIISSKTSIVQYVKIICDDYIFSVYNNTHTIAVDKLNPYKSIGKTSTKIREDEFFQLSTVTDQIFSDYKYIKLLRDIGLKYE